MLPKMKLPSRGKKWFMSITSFVVICAVFGFLSYELTKTPVTVILDGEEQKVSAHAATVKELLMDLNVNVKEHDVVKPGLNKELTEDMKVVWNPAVKIKMVNNGETENVWTTAETVQEFARQQNLAVGEHDVLQPGLNQPIEKNLKITYEAGFQVDLAVGGKGKKVWTTSTTVADLLEQQEIKLTKLDRVEPGKDTVVKKNTEVNVIRVKKVTDVVEESIDYAVVTRKDNSLPKGEEEVLDSGKEGQVAKHYEVVLENGKEVSRKLIKTETLKESEDRVVAVGTKEYSQPSRGESASSSSSSSSSGDAAKQFYVNSTAYTANCSGCSGVTSTGFNLKANPNAKVIAVDPSVIPLGTRVHVKGYGYAVAADTGGAVNGRKIDVFFSSKQEAYSWGTRRVLIKILD